MCCELWPGNVTDVKALSPVVRRLRERFGVGRVCFTADRGLISRDNVAVLEAHVESLRPQLKHGAKRLIGNRRRRMPVLTIVTS